MGTTVSALYISGDSVAIAHIGDSRIYLLRAGELSQITVDHTFVQRREDDRVDLGRGVHVSEHAHEHRPARMHCGL
ncbi:hypothetical protein ACC691_41255, partial [Rhizobium johnstonii]